MVGRANKKEQAAKRPPEPRSAQAKKVAVFPPTQVRRPRAAALQNSTERAVEVNVAAVDVKMLTGGVAGFFGEEEDDGGGDFLG